MQWLFMLSEERSYSLNLELREALWLGILQSDDTGIVRFCEWASLIDEVGISSLYDASQGQGPFD